ncbi:hypothetical protein G7Y89_g13379 [Cudoniella acicularis]|uniref:Uncharacterized protein n=1 Tax=Cudoniella acicularis TaxID=354080 RepID=A0A8H4R8E5_9HELO|nr:hypothetical protein G7Y89_g13379 [Cudoniella acicularis]
MYEVLAISALHLSTCRAGKSNLYREESTNLQVEALKLFNQSVQEINSENLVPAFLFSGILGVYSFADTFATPSGDINIFLDRLTQSIQLLQGVRKLFSASWDELSKSEIKYMMQFGNKQEENPAANEVAQHFEKLQLEICQLESVDENQAAAYNKAITQLIWAYKSGISSTAFDGTHTSSMVTSWPVMVSSEYTDLLSQREPEALIVLAYFAVLAHYCRDYWAIGNSGQYLLRALESYLGPKWETWLEWPKSVVFGAGNSLVYFDRLGMVDG